MRRCCVDGDCDCEWCCSRLLLSRYWCNGSGRGDDEVGSSCVGALVGRHLDGRHGVSCCSSSSVFSEFCLLPPLPFPFSVCTRRLSNSSPSSSIRLYSCIPFWAWARSRRICCLGLGFGLALTRLRGGCGGRRREARSWAWSCCSIPKGSSRSDSKGRKPLARTLIMLRLGGRGTASDRQRLWLSSSSSCSCITVGRILQIRRSFSINQHFNQHLHNNKKTVKKNFKII